MIKITGTNTEII